MLVITKTNLQPGLYIVATPIGNLKDITLRALEVLSSVNVIACEDTRVTHKLLDRYQIKQSMITYNDANGQKMRSQIIRRIQEGEAVALVSDAGTPLISDPGYKLVQEVQVQGLYVTTLPGASSVIAALTLAGLPTDQFAFLGFLPTKKQSCIKQLQQWVGNEVTLVCLERGSRVVSALSLIQEACGNCEMAVVREISKAFEEVKHHPVDVLLDYYQEQGAPKGEVVLIIAPQNNKGITQDIIDKELINNMKNNSLKDASKLVSEQLHLPKKQIYQRALELRDGT